jgi:hypothetical protein
MYAGKRSISQGTSQLITIFMLPLAILMIVYAMLTFYYRSKYMQQKQVGTDLSSMMPSPQRSYCATALSSFHKPHSNTSCRIRVL